MLSLSSAVTLLLLSFSHGSASSHGRSAPHRNPGVERLFQSNINIWLTPARVKILAWRPRKLQLPVKQDLLFSTSPAANVSAPFPNLRHSWASISESRCLLVLKFYLNLESGFWPWFVAMLSFSSCVVIDNTLIWRVPSPPATDLHLEWDSGRAARRMRSRLLRFLLSMLWKILPCAWVSPLLPENHGISQIYPQLIQSDQWVCLIISCPTLLPVCLCESVGGQRGHAQSVLSHPVPLSRGGRCGRRQREAGGRGGGGCPGRAEVPGRAGFTQTRQMVPGERTDSHRLNLSREILFGGFNVQQIGLTGNVISRRLSVY